jgi:uncharacterized coiled-coil protein SlyX
MDKHFLEFWGNFMVNVAKGQKQLDDMAKWMGQGFKGFEYLTALFRKCYGLDRLNEASPDYLKLWKKSEADFWESFKSYLALFGVVPKDEHLALVKKYEELKEKAASQEETIRHLRMLLGEKVVDQREVIKGFQDLMNEQTAQFQELMNSFAKAFKTGKPAKTGKAAREESTPAEEQKVAHSD